MSTTATLVYTVRPVPPVLLATLQAALAAVPIDPTEIETMTGCTLTSDVTNNDGTNAIRTIIFGLPAAFQANFPQLATQASPFKNLYTHSIGAGLGSVVAVSPVVIT